MTNVISFTDAVKNSRTTKTEEPTIIDLTILIRNVLDWASVNGVDVDNDIAFQVRLVDFMTYLELAAKDGRLDRKINI